MKNTFLLFLLSLVLHSCTELAFKSAMPLNGENLSAFPREMQGTFQSTISSSDTLVITANEVSGNRFRIGENNVVRKCGKYYVCSEKKVDRWVMGFIRLHGKTGFSVYRFDVEDSKKRKSISNITNLEEILDENGGVDYLLVSPTDAEFRRMMRSKAFIRVEKFKRI